MSTDASTTAPPTPTAPTTLVASDLDRTLIYSAASLDLAMPDAEAPDSCASRCTATSPCRT